jgi:hypothetical protein
VRRITSGDQLKRRSVFVDIVIAAGNAASVIAQPKWP